MSADPPSVRQLWLGGAILLWLLYAGVFWLTGNTPGIGLFVIAAVNVLPLLLLSAAVHRLLADAVIKRSVLGQVLTHAILAPIFALMWYSLVVVLLGFAAGAGGGSFAPVGFSGPAATWQGFQGLIIYALVAAVCYAVRGGRQAAQLAIPDRGREPLSRYLLKGEEGLRPIDVNEIVSITGAQDYAEVTLRSGHHLVRMSLGEFEKILDPARFVRVHRSSIINLDYLALAEPAGGGRMVARMNSGSDVPVSRAGAAALKELVA